MPRGAVQLVQLLRLLGHADADAAASACSADRDRRRAAGGARRAVLVAPRAPAVASAAGFDLAQLMPCSAASGRARRPSSRSARVEMLDRTARASGRLSFQAPDGFVRETLKPRRETARGRRQHADDEPRRPQPHGAARRGARGGGHRRGDPRHADRQPRRARAPVRQPASPAAPSAGRSSWCRATRACAARSPRCASAARGRRCARSQVLLADGDRSVMTIEPLAPPSAP